MEVSSMGVIAVMISSYFFIYAFMVHVRSLSVVTTFEHESAEWEVIPEYATYFAFRIRWSLTVAVLSAGYAAYHIGFGYSTRLPVMPVLMLALYYFYHRFIFMHGWICATKRKALQPWLRRLLYVLCFCIGVLVVQGIWSLIR